VELYWDDTGISSKKKCGPLWVGIANSKEVVKRSVKSRMLVAVLPGNVEIGNILSEIVGQILELRLHSFYFACYKASLPCHVTLSLVLGDSPASNLLVGMNHNHG
jgi:hypothetical protein